MYVKSVTLKGFKSFASATTLRLEPGITCIVGPNGSGKSNVVDALAWVMGEQGAKSLRGGKMEDVIFAGTAGRAPLGRAEVSLTIDNADGALPIDYSEVTISRTMFRNGGSEYAINGTHCRLLDIQELLSDSGIGKEMHVIVGQGQLDAVLRATPEERRGFIEEAAGVLKHRKRKERALRKLEAMDANLTRVADLTGEIRRQLGPLGRQAETARKAAVIQAEVRDARLRVLADDLVQLTATLEQEVADETALVHARSEVEATLDRLGGRLTDLEAQARAAGPELAAAHQRWFALTRSVERLASLATLAAERVRLLSDDWAGGGPDAPPGDAPPRDPQQLREQAERLLAQHATLVADVETDRAALAAAVEARTDAEAQYAAQQQHLAQLTRAAADRREGLATLAGRVAAQASRIEAAEAELGRLDHAVTAALQRSAVAEREFATLEASIAADEQGEHGLDAAYEDALARHDELARQVARLADDERGAEQERHTATAKAEALALALTRKDGAGALLAAGAQAGVGGSVAAALQVDHGYEAAVAAALGWAADAVVVDSLDTATDGLVRLRDQDAGRAGMLVGSTARPSDSVAWPALPPEARWARDVVHCPAPLRPALDQLLDLVALVPGLDAARALVERHPQVTAVTADGDLLAPGAVRGGGAGTPSLLEVRAAHDEARDRADEAAGRAQRARFARAALQGELAQAQLALEHTLEQLHSSDARMAAVAERLGDLGNRVRTARAEAERTQSAMAGVCQALDADRATHADLRQRLEAAGSQHEEQAEPSTRRRDELDAVAVAARSHETEVRLRLRTGEERARALLERAQSLQAAADAEVAAREREAARRERRRRQAEVAAAVRAGAAYGALRLRTAADRADELRQGAERDRAHRESALSTVRREVADLQERQRELTDSVHRDEVARAQQRLRIEALSAKAVEELGVDPQTLVEEYGPHLPVPFVPDPDDPGQADPATWPEPVPFVREAQEKRLRTAERRLAALGRVNPLALEEYAALEERHAFLTTQLEDLKRSKRDLLDIVREVDERVEQVFAEAFADTAVAFEGVFARLFPGGEGRLVLTDPSNLLSTGLEVEARPPGKKIKRLSLLSGGERSLVAVALLVAIFKARPSPFYILDEVEAALDDANLGRLILLLDELRDSSQLILITHQKKTMEVADALYGVTMRGDGVTTVVSQRMRDVAVPA
ncbi:MAG: chromosome segregation protein SMC [Dermatophilaceae bacterium]